MSTRRHQSQPATVLFPRSEKPAQPPHVVCLLSAPPNATVAVHGGVGPHCQSLTTQGGGEGTPEPCLPTTTHPGLWTPPMLVSSRILGL